MSIGLLGKKVGMTQLFAEDGTLVPVTLVTAGPCVIVQIKSDTPRTVRVSDTNPKLTKTRNDKYNALQLGFENLPEKRVNKPLKGHFESKQPGKKQLQPMRYLREFRVADVSTYKQGDEIKVDIFQVGDKIDVVGTSKGRGFMGVVKRHHFKASKDSHGTHEYFRHGGSIGQHTYPGRVWKNKRMPGQMGNTRVTVQNIEIVKIDTNRNLLFVKGAVPGPKGALVIVRKKK